MPIANGPPCPARHSQPAFGAQIPRVCGGGRRCRSIELPRSCRVVIPLAVHHRWGRNAVLKLRFAKAKWLPRLQEACRAAQRSLSGTQLCFQSGVQRTEPERLPIMEVDERYNTSSHTPLVPACRHQLGHRDAGKLLPLWHPSLNGLPLLNLGNTMNTTVCTYRGRRVGHANLTLCSSQIAQLNNTHPTNRLLPSGPPGWSPDGQQASRAWRPNAIVSTHSVQTNKQWQRLCQPQPCFDKPPKQQAAWLHALQVGRARVVPPCACDYAANAHVIARAQRAPQSTPVPPPTTRQHTTPPSHWPQAAPSGPLPLP